MQSENGVRCIDIRNVLAVSRHPHLEQYINVMFYYVILISFKYNIPICEIAWVTIEILR